MWRYQNEWKASSQAIDGGGAEAIHAHQLPVVDGERQLLGVAFLAHLLSHP